VRLLVDGDVYRTVWTSWKVDNWERYAVLTRPVQAGETIAASMLEHRRMAASVADLRGNVRILGEAMIVDAIAARDLTAGRPLTDLDVVRPVLISEGDTVFFEVKKGVVNARVAAVADEGGARGDRLRVTLLGSGREMRGVVVSRDLVRIDLTPTR
jgi:flagella basal body P-ring formation protein FlgA